MKRSTSLCLLLLVAGCGEVKSASEADGASPDFGDAATPTADGAPSTAPDAAPGIDGAVCAARPAGLLAWFPGESTEAAIGGLVGEPEGGVGFASAEVGNGFHFDGVDDYVTVHHGGALYPSGSFSIEAWIQSTDAGGMIACMYEGSGSFDGRSRLSLALDDDRKVGLFVRPATRPDGTQPAGQGLASATALSADRIHHVVAVRDAEHAALRIYLDGVLDISAPLTADGTGPLGLESGNTEDDPLTIGGSIEYQTPAPSSPFRGTIDELSIYDRAIDDATAAALHGAGALGKCLP
jgi:concanavalin A-like lectin/glucanase superfamily protein